MHHSAEFFQMRVVRFMFEMASSYEQNVSQTRPNVATLPPVSSLAPLFFPKVTQSGERMTL